MAAQTKYIFVTGGVLSGLGKGIAAASIGNIFKNRGFSVNIQKCDPYLNVDAGTLNPAEHGECFVTRDGAETDLDLGHYERFIDVELDHKSSLMSGRVLRDVINDERSGKYLGKTVQIIPHVTNFIQDKIEEAGRGYDLHIVEVGGTVGDYEGLSFIEAIREFALRVGKDNCLYVHLVYLPYLGTSKEFKTKPAQNAARQLRSLGVVPDIIIARSEMPPPAHIKAKLSVFTGVDRDAIALLPNVKTIYEVPIILDSSGISDYISQRLGLPKRKTNHHNFKAVVKRAKKDYSLGAKIAIVAKYLDNEDTYMSVFEALKSAGFKHDIGIQIEWVNAEEIEQKGTRRLSHYDAILVPGGFGKRAIEGKIAAAQYAMRKGKPYLGLCLGLQVAVVAAARQAGLKDANTVEVDKDTPDPVIHIMPGQERLWGTGGTMRLGDYECVIKRGTLAHKAYGKSKTVERHRHRYEVNNDYRQTLANAGVVFSGLSPDDKLVEIIELAGHPFFLASQFHPEFKSRPNRPHPMFDAFIGYIKATKN